MEENGLEKGLLAAMYVDDLLSESDSFKVELRMETDPELENMVKILERLRADQFQEMDVERLHILAAMPELKPAELSVFSKIRNKADQVTAQLSAAMRGREIRGSFDLGNALSYSLAVIVLALGTAIYFINHNRVNETATTISYYEKNLDGASGFGSDSSTINEPVGNLTLKIYSSEKYSDTTYTYENNLIKLYVPNEFILDLNSLPNLQYDYKTEAFSFGIGNKYFKIQINKARQKLLPPP